MSNFKTHFEQVSLEFVKQIVEEQIRAETASERVEGMDKGAPSESPPEAEGRSILQRRKIARVRPVN
jgi:hypothetical protein